MGIIKTREERQKAKLDRMLSKESIEQLNSRLVTINKLFIEKIDELDKLKSNLIEKSFFLDYQQKSDNKLLNLQKNVYEEINSKFDSIYKDIFTKYQEYMNVKNNEILDSHNQYIEKMIQLDKKFIDYEKVKEEFEKLISEFVNQQGEIEKLKLLEPIYKDTALQLIEDKIKSDQVINEVAKQGSKLILDALNNELSDLPIKEQKSFIDAIRQILEKKILKSQNGINTELNQPEKLGDKEIFHNTYQKVKNTILAGVIPMVVGPAGSGKSHAMQQIARDLGLNYYMANRIQNTFELVGFVDAAGKYVTTQFFEAFTKGGLFFFDEVDASSPEALVTINAAVAQGHMAFPGHSKNEPMHKNFKAVVAGNTYGTGSTLQYTGRNKLDAATLDRFMVIDWDYDRNLEKQKVNDQHLLEICWTLRDIVKKHQIEFIKLNKNIDNNPFDSIIISTRGIENLEKIFEQEQKNSTMTKKELFKSKFFASAKKEILSHIFNDLKSIKQITNNKYYKDIEVVLTS
jgi:cobaltochelatase CobS